ncbi:MAG: hypothetical protein GF341_02625 [candidate division Zixibacteria bacterium]|nr:hypothetical protein [candidate division Zixibacteria bacterium]
MNTSPNPRRSTTIGWLIGGVLIVTGLLATPAAAVDSSGDIQFWSDYAAFQLDDETDEAYVEFYFERKRVSFTFRRSKACCAPTCTRGCMCLIRRGILSTPSAALLSRS